MVFLTDRPAVSWFSKDPAVERWFRKYGSFSTRRGYSFFLYDWVRWVRANKQAEITPSQLIVALAAKHVGITLVTI